MNRRQAGTRLRKPGKESLKNQVWVALQGGQIQCVQPGCRKSWTVSQYKEIGKFESEREGDRNHCINPCSWRAALDAEGTMLV